VNDQQKRRRLRETLAGSSGTIAPGVTDALFARLAQDCGYGAVHLSGNAIHKNFCLPDRNLLTVTQIGQRAAQIAEATEIPVDRRRRIGMRRAAGASPRREALRARRR
jgi:2-methylisocitrate lyase-like PEP mutase family enzyme